MAGRFLRSACRILGIGAGLVLLGLAGPLLRQANASEDRSVPAVHSHAVPLASRNWPAGTAPSPLPPASSSFVRTGLQTPLREAGAAWIRTTGGTECAREVAHSGEQGTEASSDRFHVTTLRLWLYRDFVPDGSDPDIFGIEVDSAWGWGCFDVSNISYIELADYPRPIPGMPAGNPSGLGGGAATGITDFLSATLFSKKRKYHGPHHFAYGFAVQLPTASSKTLGSGKWSVGPAIEYEYECGRFTAAFVALNLWSVAGDDDRKDVNMLMIKPMITYELNHRWSAVYMPYGISVYWTKPLDDAVYFPLGGGFRYAFRLGRLDMAASAQLFQYVLRSPKGSEQDLRFMLEFNF